MAPNSQSKGFTNLFFRSLDRKPTEEEVVRELHLSKDQVVYPGLYLGIIKDDRNVATAKGPPEVTVIRSKDIFHVGIWKTVMQMEVAEICEIPDSPSVKVCTDRMVTVLYKHISMHRTRYYKFRNLFQFRKVNESMLYLADLQMKRTPDSKEAEDWYTSIVRNQLLI